MTEVKQSGGQSSDVTQRDYGLGPKIKPRDIPEMKSKDELLEVFITHVESPSLFYVYINDKNYNIDKELNIFMPQYKSMFEFGDEIPVPYTRCTCLYSHDNLWYRAIVVNSYTNEDEMLVIQVYFCDYGNSDDIIWSERRIYRMPNYFSMTFPMQAIPCAQFGIQPSDADGWEQEEIDDFYNKLSEYSDDFKNSVKCRFYLSPRIDDTLVFVNLYPPVKEEGVPFREKVSEMGRRWSISNNHCDLDLIHTLLPEFLSDIRPIRLKNAPPVVGKETPCKNSSSDSTSRGLIIDKKEANDQILRHLGVLPATEKSSDVTESEDERSGTRSPITSVACLPPAMATDFPHGKLDICSRWANIPDLRLKLPVDGVFNVIVSAVESPTRFYVNICSKETSAIMSWLEDAMHEHYSVYYGSMMKRFFDQDWVPNEGDIVCAEYKDNFCGRALVEELRKKKKGTHSANIFFVDYGFREENVPMSKIHLLSPDHFFKMPAQAVECSLMGVEKQEWTAEDRETFINACGVPDEEGAISGLQMYIPDAVDSTQEPVQVYLSRDDEIINTLFTNSGEGVESDVVTDLGSSPGDQYVVSDSSGIDADWNVTDSVFQQSMDKLNDRRREGASVRVCQFFKVRGKCMWGDRCRMYHTREEYEGDRVNLEFEQNVGKKEKVTFLDTGTHMQYPKKDSWIGLRVTTIYQPNRFYAQLLHGDGDYLSSEASTNHSVTNLSKLVDSMTRHYNDYMPLDMTNKIFAPGEVLAVRCRDGNWYRAQVLDHDSDSSDVIVKLLDTGDVEAIRQTSAHPLEPHFLSCLPIQAFECFLTGLGRPNMGWEKAAWRTVLENVEGRPLHARVDDVSPNGSLTLTVWNNFQKSTKDYRCLNDELIQKELAVPSDKENGGSGGGAWTCVDDPSFVTYPG